MQTNKTEFTYFETICAVFLRAVLRKECVGAKSDTLLGTVISRSLPSNIW